jgi:hypothetical protein
MSHRSCLGPLLGRGAIEAGSVSVLGVEVIEASLVAVLWGRSHQSWFSGSSSSNARRLIAVPVGIPHYLVAVLVQWSNQSRISRNSTSRNSRWQVVFLIRDQLL